jgi:D-xylose transport system substrate-binding protein
MSRRRSVPALESLAAPRKECSKMKRWLAWGALALAATLGLASPARAAARPKVGLSLPTQREERWVRDKQAMEAEARRLGVSARPGHRQRRGAAGGAVRNPSPGHLGEILARTTPRRSVIVDKAVRAGIRVIGYDRLVMDSPHDYHYLSFDNVVGAQGEYLTAGEGATSSCWRAHRRTTTRRCSARAP